MNIIRQEADDGDIIRLLGLRRPGRAALRRRSAPVALETPMSAGRRGVWLAA